MLTVLTVDFYKDVHSYHPFPWFIFVLCSLYQLGQDADGLKYKTFLLDSHQSILLNCQLLFIIRIETHFNIKPLKHDIYFTEFHFMLHSHNYFPRPQNSLAFWPRSHFSKTKINLWPEMWCLVTQDFVTSCVTTRCNVLQFLEQGITVRSGFGDTGILAR